MSNLPTKNSKEAKDNFGSLLEKSTGTEYLYENGEYIINRIIREEIQKQINRVEFDKQQAIRDETKRLQQEMIDNNKLATIQQRNRDEQEIITPETRRNMLLKAVIATLKPDDIKSWGGEDIVYNMFQSACSPKFTTSTNDGKPTSVPSVGMPLSVEETQFVETSLNNAPASLNKLASQVIKEEEKAAESVAYDDASKVINSIRLDERAEILAGTMPNRYTAPVNVSVLSSVVNKIIRLKISPDEPSILKVSGKYRKLVKDNIEWVINEVKNRTPSPQEEAQTVSNPTIKNSGEQPDGLKTKAIRVTRQAKAPIPSFLNAPDDEESPLPEYLNDAKEEVIIHVPDDATQQEINEEAQDYTTLADITVGGEYDEDGDEEYGEDGEENEEENIYSLTPMESLIEECCIRLNNFEVEAIYALKDKFDKWLCKHPNQELSMIPKSTITKILKTI